MYLLGSSQGALSNPKSHLDALLVGFQIDSLKLGNLVEVIVEGLAAARCRCGGLGFGLFDLGALVILGFGVQGPGP